MGFMESLSSPMGTLGVGFLRNFGQNRRRRRQMAENRRVLGQQMDFARGYYPRAVDQSRRDYAGLADQYAFGGTPGNASRPRGARVRVDGTTPQDRGVGTGVGVAPASPGQQVQNQYQNLYDTLTQKQTADQETLIKELTDRYTRGKASMQERYDRNTAALKGAGEQAGKDINRRFDTGMGKIASNAAARGISGSVVSNLEAGNERDRSDAQGRLADVLRRESIGLDTALSKDVADADAALSGDISQARESSNRFGTTLAQLLGLQKAGNLEGQRREFAGINASGVANAQNLRQGAYGDIQALLDQYKVPVDQYAPLLDAIPGAVNAHINQRSADSDPGMFGGNVNPLSLAILGSAGLGAAGLGAATPQTMMFDLYMAQLLGGL